MLKCVECIYIDDCEECETCHNGVCYSILPCDEDKCCDDHFCVNRCIPNGGYFCDFNAPWQGSCSIEAHNDPSCAFPGEEVCGWTIISGPSYNAVCASCDPNCTRSTTYCILAEPKKCYDGGSIWPPFYACYCEPARGLVDPVGEGIRYFCP